MAMSNISQKEYLKRYLSGKKSMKSKKKKKNREDISRLKIIDDDIDVFNNAAKEDLLGETEDAPQIVAIIDDRPPSLRVDEKSKTNLWIPIGSNEAATTTDMSTKLGSSLSSGFKINLGLKKEIEPNNDAYSISGTRRNELVVKEEPLSPSRTIDFPDQIEVKSEEFPNSKEINGYSPSEDRDVSPHKTSTRSFDLNNEKDISPPRRTQLNRDSDSSPLRRSKWNPTVSEDMYSGRKQHLKEDTFESLSRNDISPPRSSKWNKNISEDMSPPRKRHMKEDSLESSNKDDISPPRRSKWNQNSSEDMSPPRRSNKTKPLEEFEEDQSGFSSRRHGSGDRSIEKSSRKDIDSSNKNKKTRWSDREKNDSKMKKTLDGKKAGLQNAKELVEETIEMKQKEDELFSRISSSDLGVNASTIVRDRKTGKVRNESEEIMKAIEKTRKEEENKEKYMRWGKGVKQVEDATAKRADELREMSKPLARYADDEDLEKFLKEQEWEGDPMAHLLRKKKNKKDKLTGEKSSKPIYMGDFNPNRFRITPGHRWDGVDRSNGYEKKWFEVQNSKLAQQDESYKWSTEDM